MATSSRDLRSLYVQFFLNFVTIDMKPLSVVVAKTLVLRLSSDESNRSNQCAKLRAQRLSKITIRRMNRPSLKRT